MSEFQKKTYTMEDNVKAMMFNLKDVLKGIQETNRLLGEILEAFSQKKHDEKELLF